MTMAAAKATLFERMRAGEVLHTAWSSIPDPFTTEIVAQLGFDAVTLDMQHGGHHEDSVARGILPIVHYGKHAIVRVPVGRFDMASRALDLGAEAVIAPMINTIEDARRFAAAMKYPPLGERSWGASITMGRLGARDPQAWLGDQNRKTLAFAMIETREALAILDDILALDGIDGIFVGPGDFSIAWTSGKRIDATLPDMMDAIADIAARTTAAGKVAAIYIVDPPTCGSFARMGFTLLAHGAESRFMALGANAILSQSRESIGQS